MRYTVKDWVEHVEIAMGFKPGITIIGDILWTRRIYQDFCEGKASFGATGTHAMEALLMVIKTHNSNKYDLALTGLKRTIEHERNRGKACLKLAKMYERMGGEPISF